MDSFVLKALKTLKWHNDRPGYDDEYCPFHGLDREILAYFCEDYKPAEENHNA